MELNEIEQNKVSDVIHNLQKWIPDYKEEGSQEFIDVINKTVKLLNKKQYKRHLMFLVNLM